MSQSNKTSNKKRKPSPAAENGASSSYSSSALPRNYEEILNRPSLLEVPVSSMLLPLLYLQR